MSTPDSRDLMVTIRCLVYNHEPYLRQCLDGFVMQQTNFRFEAIVHDDASTDGSAAIIREYAAKYPDIIKPIYETENQYSKRDGSIRRIMNEHTHGKYVAMCEGDDYWTDSLKLQKQVDFLESHPDYVMCWHQCRFYYQAENKFTIDYPSSGIETITSSDFLNGLSMPQTLTLLYKREALDLKAHEKSKFVGDIVLYYMLLMHGKGHCMGEVMGVYRIHGNGAWSGANLEKKFLWELKARMSIYEINPQRETAIYLLRMIEKSNSRLSLIKLTSKLLPIYRIIYRHLGLSLLLRFLINRFVFNKKTVL